MFYLYFVLKLQINYHEFQIIIRKSVYFMNQIAF
jgi:hypothetical protein